MDRNSWLLLLLSSSLVALRKESVDRNQKKSIAQKAFDASLSARRAWIEMGARALSGPRAHCRSPQGERG